MKLQDKIFTLLNIFLNLVKRLKKNTVMALGVLSYPKLKKEDFDTIQKYRKEHDELYFSIVRPHFSFVFPITGIRKQRFIAEVIEKSNGMKSFEFEIKCATINKDAFIDYYHLLLLPEIGYSNIIKLHDRLYSHLFFRELRMDIDFIPHMGIANSKDRYKVKSWVDNWNKKDFSISGMIDSLTVVDYTNNILTDLHEVSLD